MRVGCCVMLGGGVKEVVGDGCSAHSRLTDLVCFMRAMKRVMRIVGCDPGLE
jgi:hypothetical protein